MDPDGNECLEVGDGEGVVVGGGWVVDAAREGAFGEGLLQGVEPMAVLGKGGRAEDAEERGEDGNGDAPEQGTPAAPEDEEGGSGDGELRFEAVREAKQEGGEEVAADVE